MSEFSQGVALGWLVSPRWGFSSEAKRPLSPVVGPMTATLKAPHLFDEIGQGRLFRPRVVGRQRVANFF